MSTQERPLSAWLPITKKEVEERGWGELDIILITGDAYIDHPAFGAAVIGRIIQSEGFRVAIIPQPNWQDDLRDFKKLGAPKLFFAVTSGNMDSMVNHYTARMRRRATDAYSPGGTNTLRPDYALTVYTQILKKLYPENFDFFSNFDPEYMYVKNIINSHFGVFIPYKIIFIVFNNIINLFFNIIINGIFI